MISKDYLLDENYYIKLLPMLLRDSYGFKEQLTYYVKLFQQMDFVCDQYINSLDLYNLFWNKDKPWEINGVKYSTYESFLADVFGKTPFIILDFIASLVGVSRNLTYEYITENEQHEKITNRENLVLNNTELYHYILIAIARNNYDGTREMIDKTYQKAFIDSGIADSITYLRPSNLNCQVLVQIVYNASMSDNDKILFQSGNYLIKSLGIDYSIRMVESEENIFKLGTSKMDDIKYQI